ncbi:hypothetical protein LCGC14_0305850 [marine sediment metagenome]|uniref:Uncharacterized protein n=1 Tax=marine sediment metagenome TaxID=412755 RepID=A0A0F9WAM4_9ZZZZ
MLDKIAEKYLKDNTATLEKILKRFKPIFEQVDKLKKATTKLDAANTTAVKDTLTKLTGYYMEIVDILRKIEALKKNKETAYYHTKKVEIENSDTKFVSAPVDKEASLYVADERRVRSILQGKLDACLEGMRTCRTFVHDNKNVNLNPEEN